MKRSPRSASARRSPPRCADRGFDDLDAPIRRLNGVHTPTPYSPPLEAAVVPNPETIAQAIRDLIAE